jgi:hypothetical protein
MDVINKVYSFLKERRTVIFNAREIRYTVLGFATRWAFSPNIWWGRLGGYE